MKLTRKDLFFILLSAGFVFLYVQGANGSFPLDDSWIHQVYGRNLGQHGEWAFTLGEPSAASTAPLYTVLLAIGYMLHISYGLWTHLLGTLALAATAILGSRIAEKLLPTNGWIGLITGIALVTSWHLIWSAASGMETMLFSMFTLLLIYLGLLEETIHGGTRQIIMRGALFGLVTALAATTRPEGILLAGIIGALLLKHNTSRQTLIWGSAAAIVFMLAISPYLILNLHLADSLLPNTSAAKFAQHRPLLETPYLQRLFGMILPILIGGQFLLIPGMAYYIVTYRKKIIYLAPLLWFLGLTMLYAARLPATYQHGRYVIPALPAFIVMSVTGMAILFKQSQKTAGGRIITRTLSIACAVSFIYFAVGPGANAYKTDVQLIDEEMVAQAKWIEQNLPEDELLAIHDIGAVGYFAPRPLLDIAGLLNPEIHPLIGDAEGLWNLMEMRDTVYLMAFTDQIPGQTPYDSRLCPLHQTQGTTSESLGGTKMVIYRLLWDNTIDCDVQ